MSLLLLSNWIWKGPTSGGFRLVSDYCYVEELIWNCSAATKWSLLCVLSRHANTCP